MRSASITISIEIAQQLLEVFPGLDLRQVNVINLELELVSSMEVVRNFLNKPCFTDVFAASHVYKGERVVLILEPSNYVMHVLLISDV